MLERYVIHLTKDCNCQCVYCYEKDKYSKYSWEEIKTLIDNIVNHNQEFSVEFLGGEPVLEWGLLVKAYEYMESLNISIPDYHITTNGTIMDDEIVSYLKNNKKLRWSISVDGHLTANQLRVFKDGRNTLPKVLENIKILQNENIPFSIHMITHPYNIGYLSDSVDYFYSLGIKNIDIGIVESTIKIDKEFCDRYILEMGIISKKIKDGIYPDLVFYPFRYVKPKNDIRTYVRDEKGKVIAESYGRVENDITNTTVYNNQKCTQQTEIKKLIQDLREKSYNIHKENN